MAEDIANPRLTVLHGAKNWHAWKRDQEVELDLHDLLELVEQKELKPPEDSDEYSK